MLQNHLKAIFVDIYMTGNIVLFLVAVYTLMYESHSLAWAGTAIASGVVTGLFGMYYAGRLPRTSRHIPLLLVLALLGSAALAKRMNVPFQFLTDPCGQASRKLGIAHQAGLPLGLQIFGYYTNTVFPTLIVIDQNGKIVFVDQTENYRVRPELDVVLGKMGVLSGT
ncbi:MAG TPA: hypothetical protein PLE48_02505 [Thiobacillus sp.]|nr:MAG: hypothetical protein B7Y21_01495 [Hydrogenophilales bacterium 16-61-112]OZA50901.1 MAG: hypothetical protein B7X81_01115 [Hydrogenophilales bacterium 17-61-76]HQT30151.1 hypothetical protein [Thiobacillus sp.]HQT69278.1 hypothetical protein [Thiobacillus sp.]